MTITPCGFCGYFVGHRKHCKVISNIIRAGRSATPFKPLSEVQADLLEHEMTSRIAELTTFYDKMEYLTKCFEHAKSRKEEETVLSIFNTIRITG